MKKHMNIIVLLFVIATVAILVGAFVFWKANNKTPSKLQGVTIDETTVGHLCGVRVDVGNIWLREIGIDEQIKALSAQVVPEIGTKETVWVGKEITVGNCIWEVIDIQKSNKTNNNLDGDNLGSVTFKKIESNTSCLTIESFKGVAQKIRESNGEIAKNNIQIILSEEEYGLKESLTFAEDGVTIGYISYENERVFIAPLQSMAFPSKGKENEKKIKEVFCALQIAENNKSFSDNAPKMGYNYEEVVQFTEGEWIQLPDFKLVYRGSKETQEGRGRPFTYYMFEIKNDTEQKEIQWTYGTGDISPTVFDLDGRTYYLHMHEKVTLSNGKEMRLGDEELMIVGE